MKTFAFVSATALWVFVSVAQTQGADSHRETRITQHAQHGEHGEHAAQQTPQKNPYAGTSAGLTDAQRSQYLNGEGMGFAKPAEMNHYPGPRHVLQNVERLKLSPEQISSTQTLFDAVQKKAKALGNQIVDREDELLQLFSSQNADEARVKQLTAQIGSLQGELRATHLLAHLKQRTLLTAEQVKIYDRARDYIPGEKPAPPTRPQ